MDLGKLDPDTKCHGCHWSAMVPLCLVTRRVSFPWHLRLEGGSIIRTGQCLEPQIVPGVFGLARNIIEHLRGVRLRSIQRSFFLKQELLAQETKVEHPKT